MTRPLFGGPSVVRDGLSFRTMDLPDLPAVIELERRSFLHPWSEDLLRKELTHEWSTVLLAHEGDALVGVLIFWLVHDEIHVLNVAVDPARRRRGVARTLLTLLLERATEAGAALATLEVRSRNEGAIALYRSLGFRRVGLRRGYYAEEGEDAVVMTRDLSPP